MINVMRSGRLGNNMFQFAFAYSASKRLHTDFIYDTCLLKKYFYLGHYDNFLLGNYRRLKYLLDLKFHTYKSLDLSADVPPAAIKSQVQDHAVIYGYFQSDQFFREDRERIRSLFKVKDVYLKAFKEKFGNYLKGHIVVIAIRLSDFKDWKPIELDNNSPELPMSYYKKKLSDIDLFSKTVFFISDQIEEVRKIFQMDNAVYVKEEIDSLLSLIHADEIILSNSSFHWWGAWLNPKPGKTAYAPKYWLGHKINKEYPKGAIPDDWRQVEV